MLLKPQKKPPTLFLLINGLCFPFIKRYDSNVFCLFLVYFLEGCPKQVMMLGKKTLGLPSVPDGAVGFLERLCRK